MPQSPSIGLEWPLLTTEDLVVGRGSQVDLVLTEPTISRSHVKLGFDGRRVFVRDLGSVNGTRVNGVPRESAVLSNGDVIQIGQLVLRVRVPECQESAGEGGE